MSDDDDANKLAEISRELPPIDIDEASAQRIALAARQSVGRGPSPTRFIEPVLVGPPAKLRAAAAAYAGDPGSASASASCQRIAGA